MKTQSYFLVLSIVALALFTSCDPNAVEGTTNYWNSNTLVRLHLNGKVKTLNTDNGSIVMNFNQDGFLTSEVRSSGAGVATTAFIYASTGELTRTDFSSTMSTPTVSYSTNFQYQDNGKFVVAFPIPEHLVMVGEFQVLSGLVPNLKSTSMNNGGYNSTTTYTFNGDKLTILNLSTQGTEIYKDTAVATYNGKYPTSLFNGGSYANNISYTSNGMFKAVTIGYEGSSNTTTHYFKADNTFLLKDSVVETTVSNGVPSKMVRTYTYDSNKNVTLEESSSNSTKYEYEYDSHQNWTKRTTRYKYQGATEWGAPYTETRTITYW